MSKKNEKSPPNIGKNTKWDSPSKTVKGGATIPKPPTSLDPNRKKGK